MKPPSPHRKPPLRKVPRRIEERATALFLLGLVLFSPLLLRIFDRGANVDVFGLPLLFFYAFAAWALIIALLAASVERGNFGREPPAGTLPTQAEPHTRPKEL